MRRHPGFTLAEVLVASAIIGLITLTGLILFQFGNSAGRKTDERLEIFRQGSQALLRIRREMRGASVSTPAPGEAGQEIVYRYPQVDNGVLKVNALGSTVYQGQARIFLDGNQLMLEKPVDGDVQLLARLESPVFEVTTDEEFLEIYLKTGPTEQPQLTYERRFRLAR